MLAFLYLFEYREPRRLIISTAFEIFRPKILYCFCVILAFAFPAYLANTLINLRKIHFAPCRAISGNVNGESRSRVTKRRKNPESRVSRLGLLPITRALCARSREKIWRACRRNQPAAAELPLQSNYADESVSTTRIIWDRLAVFSDSGFPRDERADIIARPFVNRAIARPTVIAGR